MIPTEYQVVPGNWDQGGATVTEAGVNFCVFSRRAERVDLLLFDGEEATAPFQVIPLDPRVNRTFFFWHVLVLGLPDGTYYNWRVRGRCDTRESGCRFDGAKALLDPWATTVSDQLWDRGRAGRPGENLDRAMRAQVVRDAYDWEGDDPIHIPLKDAVIYEVHLADFTRHPSSSVATLGPDQAFIEKIPYLQQLGITHVGTAADHGVRRPGRPAHDRGAGTGELLGLQHPQLLRPPPRLQPRPRRAPGTSSAIWSRPCTEPGSG